MYLQSQKLEEQNLNNKIENYKQQNNKVQNDKKQRTQIKNAKSPTMALKTQNKLYKPFSANEPRRIKEEAIGEEKGSIRQEARTYVKVAKATYDDFKNRGQGDSRVKSMLYASWQLGKVCKRILRREVTPKVIYEFHFAKHLFETAQHMEMHSCLELPKQYEVALEALRKREEEENYDWYSLEDEEE